MATDPEVGVRFLALPDFLRSRHPQKLALTSPTSGSHLFGIVLSQTESIEFSGSGMGSAQPREYNLRATWKKK
jgi:hypothetical protein